MRERELSAEAENNSISEFQRLISLRIIPRNSSTSDLPASQLLYFTYFIISNRQAPGESITRCTQQSRTRLRLHRVQKRLPHGRTLGIWRDLNDRRCNLCCFPCLPARVDLLQILRLPCLIAIGPLHIRSAWTPRTASARLV